MKKIEEIVRKSAMMKGLVVVELTIKANDKIDAILYSRNRSVTVGDLEEVTREIQRGLELIGLEGVYSINLSSPGLDRVLKTEEELNIFAGRMVKVSYFRDEKLVVKKGILGGLRNDCVLIEQNGNSTEIKMGKVASIQLWDALFDKGGKNK